jgi:hypothetical protein
MTCWVGASVASELVSRVGNSKLLNGRGWIDVRELSCGCALDWDGRYGWFRVPGSIEV